MKDAFESIQVVLNLPLTLEEDVVDWLLDRHGGVGFTSCSVYGRSSRMTGLSAAEQVHGRRKRVQFQVLLKSDDAAEFLTALTADFSGADVYYHLHPVIASGHTG